jgi:2-oxoglutarate dehydrogenase E2 component (dihydrolipoamide succinyltransferase)
MASVARLAPLRSLHHRRPNPLVMLPSLMQTVRAYADKVVKVPQMAESISEGTLKQFSKSIGDFVEQDEEIATIETDKVSRQPGWQSTKTKLNILTPVQD